ncbi:hypothetical protein BD769DRAFT_1383221 [Suillus cothurnatus]|nr:hypothetical protein BD769DRAFT_1383221 [Suillus cothurnatus]
MVLHPKAHTLQAGDLLSSIELVGRHDQVTIECDIKKPLVLKPGPCKYASESAWIDATFDLPETFRRPLYLAWKVTDECRGLHTQAADMAGEKVEAHNHENQTNPEVHSGLSKEVGFGCRQAWDIQNTQKNVEVVDHGTIGNEAAPVPGETA